MRDTERELVRNRESVFGTVIHSMGSRALQLRSRPGDVESLGLKDLGVESVGLKDLGVAPVTLSL